MIGPIAGGAECRLVAAVAAVVDAVAVGVDGHAVAGLAGELREAAAAGLG